MRSQEPYAIEDKRSALGQFNTPDWVAVELTERYFGDLTLCDVVLEPSCGTGAFLRAVPDHVPAYGIEIDPDVAVEARRRTHREILIGDFLTIDLEPRRRPTLILGNPPFRQAIIQGFLERAWSLLPDEGRCGFVVPAFAFQTASVVDRLARRWSIRSDLIPRNIFNRLSTPLCFAQLTKTMKERVLVGFALYGEVAAVQKLRARYRAILAGGEQRSVWTAIVVAALEQLGGEATLPELYREIEPHRPTKNTFWQAKVRQTVQRIAIRRGRGAWALPPKQTQLPAAA